MWRCLSLEQVRRARREDGCGVVAGRGGVDGETGFPLRLPIVHECAVHMFFSLSGFNVEGRGVWAPNPHHAVRAYSLQ